MGWEGLFVPIKDINRGKVCEYCDPKLNDASFLCRYAKKGCRSIGDNKEKCEHYGEYKKKIDELKERGIL